MSRHMNRQREQEFQDWTEERELLEQELEEQQQWEEERQYERDQQDQDDEDYDSEDQNQEGIEEFEKIRQNYVDELIGMGLQSEIAQELVERIGDEWLRHQPPEYWFDVYQKEI